MTLKRFKGKEVDCEGDIYSSKDESMEEDGQIYRKYFQVKIYFMALYENAIGIYWIVYLLC